MYADKEKGKTHIKAYNKAYHAAHREALNVANYEKQ
jgi:hypothetical protein